MNQKKKEKCRDLNVKLRNMITVLEGRLRQMNAKNDEAMSLRSEINRLENELSNVPKKAALNVVGLGDKKGRGFSMAGLAMDGLDGVDIARQIKAKISELSYVIRDQNKYQREAENYERVINSTQNRLDQMGCN